MTRIEQNGLSEIPSEFIEPYLVTFVGQIIESVGFGFIKPDRARQDLKGVMRFVSQMCGIHARMATNNKYSDFIEMSDEEMIGICRKVCGMKEKQHVE
jgi:hypothetical protein